jgi:hypothetical protein
MKAPAVELSPGLIVAGVAVVAVAAFALYAWRKGGAGAAAAGLGQAAGAAVVNLAGGAASGAVGAVSATVGLPTPDETVTEAAQARYIIDRWGYLAASKWAGAPALFGALGMPAGTGKAPPQGWPGWAQLGPGDGGAAAAPPARKPPAVTLPDGGVFSLPDNDPYALLDPFAVIGP